MSPNILDYLEDDGDDIDLIAYEEAEKDHVEEKRRRINISVLAKKKPYLQRKQYRRRNPRDSIWYIDYVLDLALGEILIIGMGNSSTIDFLILSTQWLK